MRRPLAAALAAGPLAALACGVCVDDKVAITYDHAVVTAAVERKQVVVFAAVEGRTEAAALARRLEAAAAKVKGVERGSVRAAPSPAALSFVIDPRVQTPEAALAAVARAADSPGLKLTLIRLLP